MKKFQTLNDGKIFMSDILDYEKNEMCIHTYRRGRWREPFAVPSEEDLSFSAAYYMNKQPARFCEYLSIDQVKWMRRTMPL